MIVDNFSPLDPNAPVVLRVEVTDAAQDRAWLEPVRTTLATFEAFAGSGALAETAADTKLPATRFEPAPMGFTYSLASFPFGNAGLGVLLRMLGQLAVATAPITRVTVEGTPLAAELHGVLSRDKLVALPALRSELPFELDIQPVKAWVNIECEFDYPVAHEVALALHERLVGWARAAEAGAFNVLAHKRGVAVIGPTEGEDFLSWQCQMPDVHPESLRTLVNVVASFATQVAAIRELHLT